MTALRTDTERLDARREQHTEGPWVVDDGACGPAVAGAVRAASGWYIARVYENGPNPAADQRLIAAAPDLLAALTQALAESDHAEGCLWFRKNIIELRTPEQRRAACDCWRTVAQQVIAKATAPVTVPPPPPPPEGAGR